MQVSIESGEGLERRMTVALSVEQVQQEVDKRLQDLAGRVRVDGFRPGKVPMRIVRQRYADSVRQDVVGELIQSSFYEAAAKENVKPAGMPNITNLDLEQASYVAEFEVVPEVALADLSGVAVKRPLVAVAESDVDAMIEKLRKQRASWSVVERAAAEGDQVLISFKGLLDGVAFEGGTAEDVPVVLGSNSLIDGFEQGLVGASAGENRSLALKFPEDYRVEHLAGKDVVFEVELKEVRHQVLPEVDEGFIKLFGIDSGEMEAFRADIRGNMERELKQKIKSTVKERVMDALVQNNAIDVPKSMIAQESEVMKRQAKQTMAQRGQSSSFDLPAEIFADQAKRRVSLGLLIGEIIKANGIKLDNERVSTTIDELAQSYEEPAEVVEYYKKNKEGRANLESLVLEDQVMDWVLGQLKVEDEVFDFETFMKPDAA